MSNEAAAAPDKDATTQREPVRSNVEEPPEEGADQQGTQSSGKVDAHLKKMGFVW